MSSGIRSDASGTFGALTFGGDDVFRFGSDNSGQLSGFRNILINGDMRINQRNVTIAAAANGSYGSDRWKKVDASSMTQIVEAGNFIPSTVYTLSGTGVTTQQLTSPASGDWTLPNIPIAATNIQLEEGSIATPFEQRPIGLELSLCQRYYLAMTGIAVGGYNAATFTILSNYVFPTTMRATPTITWTSFGTQSNATSPAFFGTTKVSTGPAINTIATGAAFIYGATATANAEL